MTATAQATVAYLSTFLGTPYEYGGEGTAPGQPLDCSRLMQNGMVWAGWADFPRTTTTQYFDSGFVQLPRETPPILGDLLYIEVNADGGQAPQHVGMYVGNGQYIEAPETGESVKITTIPNAPGEFVYGILRPAYASVAPPVPPPTPEELDMYFIGFTPSGNGYWLCSETGAIITRGDAQYLGGPNTSEVNGEWGGPPNLQAGHTITGFQSFSSSQGYSCVDDTGLVYSYGAAPWLGNAS